MATVMPGLPPPRPIPIRERASILFLEKGRLDVLDGAFVVVDETGVRIHIPVGGVVCLMLEPGTRVSHAAVALAAGYAPALGFLHSGKPQSFVYDIADLFKFETVVPEAFRVASAAQAGRVLDGRPIGDPVAEVRRRCRDAFRRTDILSRLIPAIEDVLAAGGLPMPEAPPEAMPVAFEDAGKTGDDGHRG